MKKLILLGDSLFAYFHKSEVLKFEKLLPDFDIYDCAVGGWDTNDCLKKAEYISRLKPDVLMFSVGTNDASPWKQVDLETFKANITKIIDIFSGSKFIFFLPPPVNEAKLSPEHNTLKNNILKEYNDAAKQVCITKNIPYLDSWNLFEPLLSKGDDYHVDDGVHLDDSGNDMLMSNLAKLIVDSNE